ncbi:hypothetical protein ABZP36_035482, partial [Zizania latifolia]
GSTRNGASEREGRGGGMETRVWEGGSGGWGGLLLAVREFVAGGVAKTAIAPLEHVKILCQVGKIICGIMSTEEVGVNMLKSLFEIHRMTRTKIIEQCKFQILSAKAHIKCTSH